MKYVSLIATKRGDYLNMLASHLCNNCLSLSPSSKKDGEKVSESSHDRE